MELTRSTRLSRRPGREINNSRDEKLHQEYPKVIKGNTPLREHYGSAQQANTICSEGRFCVRWMVQLQFQWLEGLR